MPVRRSAARPAQAGRLSRLWHTLHAGTAAGRDDGVVGGCLCRLLSLSPSGRGAGMTEGFALSCPIPDGGGDIVEIAHGGGGLLMHRLIDRIIRPAFGLPENGVAHDGAVFEVGSSRMAFTTDSYVVRPL